MNGQGFLRLRIAGEAFGGELHAVREIIPLGPVTHVPFTDPAVLGVINLRGNIVPVIDGALRLGRKRSPHERRGSVVIVEVGSEHEAAEIGLVVDAVEAVGDLSSEEVFARPEFGVEVPADFLLGVGRHGDALLPLLDLRAMLSLESLSQLVVT